VAWGAQDEIFPAAYAEEWQLALPQARIVVIEGAGHLPHVERIGAFLASTGLFDS